MFVFQSTHASMQGHVPCGSEGESILYFRRAATYEMERLDPGYVAVELNRGPVIPIFSRDWIST